MLSKALFFCLGFVFLASHLLCNPIPSNEDLIYVESRLGNYRRRFLTLAQDIDPKYERDLNLLIQQFEAVIEGEDLFNKANLLEHFMEKLDPSFANYLQYELDLQLLDEDINIEIWYLEQLLTQIDDAELAVDIGRLLRYYQIARNTRIIDKKYDIFSSIENEMSPRLLDYLDAEPIPTALLNVHLELFREFLLYLLKHGDVGDFEENIKNSLIDIEIALSESGLTYEQEEELLDRFDDITSDFGQFLDTKIHEFEIYKFGRI